MLPVFGLYVPAGQGKHVAAVKEGLYVPAAQFVQTEKDVPPETEEDIPKGHAMQAEDDVLPVNALYVPGGHD